MTVHQEHLPRLERFSAVLGRTMLQCGLPPDHAAEIFHNSISAECVQCGIEVSGSELLALSQAAPEDENLKLKRLRLGDCARQGCNSFYYRISFTPCSSLDWPILLTRIETDLQRPAEPAKSSATRMVFRRPAWLPSIPRRLWITLGLVFLLLIARQWHRGGRIPLLREPEHFRVDPAPEDVGQQETR
jgi:hypothetical protein